MEPTAIVELIRPVEGASFPAQRSACWAAISVM
jgi:hypothetical protein